MRIARPSSVQISRRAALTASLAVVTAGSAAGAQPAERVSTGSYASGDQMITVVVFSPSIAGLPMTGAAILLLHGGGGAGLDLQRWYEHAAKLARRGYTVAFPAWFGDSAQGGRAVRGEGARQRQAVLDGIDWLASQPGIDPERIATMGFSRGGHAACDVAITQARVAAVVAIASGGGREISEILRKPPVLLIYADGDPVVRAGRVLNWERTLRRAGVPVETEVLDADYHVPEPAEWHAIFERAHGFFRRRLTVSS